MKKYVIILVLILLPISLRAQDTLHIAKNIEGGVTLGLGIPSGLSVFIFHRIVGDLYGEAGAGLFAPWYTFNAGLKIFTDSSHLFGMRYSSMTVWLDLSDRSWKTIIPALSIYYGSAGLKESSTSLFWGIGIMLPLAESTSILLLPFAEIGFRF